MISHPILLDFQSSTPCLKEVVDEMNPYWTEIFANPSSKSNFAAIKASAALEFARQRIKHNLNLTNKKIIFTSGATESNNLALFGFARNYYKKTGSYGNIITLQTEHHAVLEPLRKLERDGFSLTEISPEEDGLISEEKFLNAIKDDTFLVSIMFANNEIGVVQPIKNISEICKRKKIILHTDAAQYLGYLPINDFESIANMITISSHKIYGPKGVGLLLLDKEIKIEPLIFGGGQELGLRSGTLPLPLIIGFSKAVELSVRNQPINAIKLLNLRDKLLKGLLLKNPDIIVNGSLKNRLPNNLNITIQNVSGSLLHKYLKPKIICSSGSACSNGKPSHVLTSLGRSFKDAESSIRLSVGLNTTSQEIEEAISVINNAINHLRS